MTTQEKLGLIAFMLGLALAIREPSLIGFVSVVVGGLAFLLGEGASDD